MTILALQGDVGLESKEAIETAYLQLVPQGHRLLLDFSAVSYINSSGIAIIIQLLVQARVIGQGRIGIFGLKPHFKKVFEIVGVDKYATLSADQATALHHLDQRTES